MIESRTFTFVFWREKSRAISWTGSTHLIRFFIRICFEILGIGIFWLPFPFAFLSGFFFLFIRIFFLIGIFFIRIVGIFGLPFPTSLCSFFFGAGIDFFDIGIRVSCNKIEDFSFLSWHIFSLNVEVFKKRHKKFVAFSESKWTFWREFFLRSSLFFLPKCLSREFSRMHNQKQKNP